MLVTDNRDDPLLPSEGYLTKLTHEVAGLGGDVCFSKAEVQTEMFKEIFPEWVSSTVVYLFLKPFCYACNSEYIMIRISIFLVYIA